MVQPRQSMEAVSRKDGTIQSVRRRAATLPIWAASWRVTGAKVRMRPWRWRRSMRSSKRRPRSIARWRRLSSSGAIGGSRAESRLPSLSRMDRCSTVNCGSIWVLGMAAGSFLSHSTPVRSRRPPRKRGISLPCASGGGCPPPHPPSVPHSAATVAAALRGGLTVSCADGPRVTAVSLAVPREIEWVVLLPETESSTREARAVLPESVPRVDAIFNVQRVSLFLAALAAGRVELLALAMQDRLHQPYRLRLFPWMYAVAAAGPGARARGCVRVRAGAALLRAGPPPGRGA